ncbi:MAG: hypothetical protein ACI4XM_07455 [Candidatus Coprovivens sp.]
MENIDYYIEQSRNMNNTSDGGSAAYHFEDVVLVKYSIPVKYGIARPNEEQTAEAANRLNEKGVRTPKHLAIKRVVEGNDNICYVLQQRAPGKCFSYYADIGKLEPIRHLARQKELLEAPDIHYENWVSDLMMMHNMGLELKYKNFFYDVNEGFTIIDLLGYDEKNVDVNSLDEIDRLVKNAFIPSYSSQLSQYGKNSTQEEKEQSYMLANMMRLRIFKAIRKMVPDFQRFEKWILRTFPNDYIEFFKQNGMQIDDLSLSEEEYKQFEEFIEIILDRCMKDIQSGKIKYWEVAVNKIRNYNISYCLNEAWRVHRDNSINLEDYEDDYDYRSDSDHSLEKIMIERFNIMLENASLVSDNPNVLQAKEDMDATLEKRKKNLF